MTALTLADIQDAFSDIEWKALPDQSTYNGAWFEEHLDSFKVESNARLSTDPNLPVLDRKGLDQQLQELIEKFNISENSLSLSQIRELANTLEANSGAFAQGPYDLGHYNGGEHVIDTGKADPISTNPHRMNKNDERYLKEELQELMRHGIIEEKPSEWASPIVMVPKKDGSKRLCVDFRKINTVAKCPAYPIPKIQDIFRILQGSKYFTSIDLAKGFWQIGLSPESQPKTSFTTCFGQFQFIRLPFGLNSSPAAFQSTMNNVLEGLLWNRCVVYIDDILIFTSSFEEHVTVLRQVLQRLTRFNLKANAKKCDFARTQLEYLGHIINSIGLAVNPKQVEAVRAWKFPNCVLEVERFLGKVNYYAKFIEDFAKLAKPLYDLTQKKATRFFPMKEHYCAFDELKDRLCQSPVLRHPDFEKEFILYTDASGYGIGAVLSQELTDGIHPIAYASRSLKETELRYSATDREALGIFWAVNQFQEYLAGRHFTVYTDHKPLVVLMTQYHTNRRLTIISMRLAHLTFTIKYRPGSENVNADILSRYPYAPVKGRKSRVTQTNESQVNQFDPNSELSDDTKVLSKRSKVDSLAGTVATLHYSPRRDRTPIKEDTEEEVQELTPQMLHHIVSNIPVETFRTLAPGVAQEDTEVPPTPTPEIQAKYELIFRLGMLFDDPEEVQTRLQIIEAAYPILLEKATQRLNSKSYAGTAGEGLFREICRRIARRSTSLRSVSSSDQLRIHLSSLCNRQNYDHNSNEKQ